MNNGARRGTRTPNWVNNEKLANSARPSPADDVLPERGDVLLIEDDVSIAEMYAFGLAANGYEVRVATSGESALSEADHGEHFGVIVLDLELPQMNGLTVLDELRHKEATAHVPVIVLSNADVDITEAERHGANEFHPKYRTTPRELVGYVARTLSGAA